MYRPASSNEPSQRTVDYWLSMGGVECKRIWLLAGTGAVACHMEHGSIQREREREEVTAAWTDAINFLGQSPVSAAVKASVLHSKITANWNCSDVAEVAVQDACFWTCCVGGNTGLWHVIWKWNNSYSNEHSSQDKLCNLYCPTYRTQAIKSRKMWAVQNM